MKVLRGVVYMTKTSEPWGTPQEDVHQEEFHSWHRSNEMTDMTWTRISPECKRHLDLFNLFIGLAVVTNRQTLLQQFKCRPQLCTPSVSVQRLGLISNTNWATAITNIMRVGYTVETSRCCSRCTSSDDAGRWLVPSMSWKEPTTLASLSHSFLTPLYECGSRVVRQTFQLATP